MPEHHNRSIGALFERNRHDLLSYLTSKVGREDALDLLQETFVRVLRRAALDDVVDSKAFLKRVATNLIRDLTRRRKTEANIIQFGDYIVEVEALSDEATLEEHIEYERKSLVQRAAVDSLPPRCREVFELYIQPNISAQEIAQRLQISDRMVRKHLTLALRSFRSALRQSEE